MLLLAANLNHICVVKVCVIFLPYADTIQEMNELVQRIQDRVAEVETKALSSNTQSICMSTKKTLYSWAFTQRLCFCAPQVGEASLRALGDKTEMSAGVFESEVAGASVFRISRAARPSGATDACRHWFRDLNSTMLC